jgi:hypothetical protein
MGRKAPYGARDHDAKPIGVDWGDQSPIFIGGMGGGRALLAAVRVAG